MNLVDLSGPQHSLNTVDFSTSPNLDRETVSTQKQPATLNREQLGEVTRAVIAATSSRTETSHPQNELTQDSSAEYQESILFSKSSVQLCEVIGWVRWPGEGVSILLVAEIYNPWYCLNQVD